MARNTSNTYRFYQSFNIGRNLNEYFKSTTTEGVSLDSINESRFKYLERIVLCGPALASSIFRELYID